MWPCIPVIEIDKYNENTKIIKWKTKLVSIYPKDLIKFVQFISLNINEDWFYKKSSENEEFGFKSQNTKLVMSTVNEAPNSVRLKLEEYLFK